jgi:hypothetical protein
MLRAFCTIRSLLVRNEFKDDPRRITGTIRVGIENIEDLKTLQNEGYITEARDAGGSVEFVLLRPPFCEVQITLSPGSLPYYENLEDLILHTADEPNEYFIFDIGMLRSTEVSSIERIESYRLMLRAKKLLQSIADFADANRAVLFAPEKLDIPFICLATDLRALPGLSALEAQLSLGSVEREQRIILFKRSLREHLRSQPVEDHFRLFIRNFTSIYDSYNRDFELWLGNTFGELEKSFEEKRLKFISDLNGILAGVQTSILAVPIAAILLGDKYDLANPLKNFLLAVAVALLATVALKLLHNQEHTLDATRKAIDSTKTDFEKKHSQRREEFRTRLDALDHQENRVRLLLRFMRNMMVGIVFFAGLSWLISFWQWEALRLSAIPKTIGTPTPQPIPPATGTPKALGSSKAPTSPVSSPASPRKTP